MKVLVGKAPRPLEKLASSNEGRDLHDMTNHAKGKEHSTAENAQAQTPSQPQVEHVKPQQTLTEDDLEEQALIELLKEAAEVKKKAEQEAEFYQKAQEQLKKARAEKAKKLEPLTTWCGQHKESEVKIMREFSDFVLEVSGSTTNVEELQTRATRVSELIGEMLNAKKRPRLRGSVNAKKDPSSVVGIHKTRLSTAAKAARDPQNKAMPEQPPSTDATSVPALRKAKVMPLPVAVVETSRADRIGELQQSIVEMDRLIKRERNHTIKANWMATRSKCEYELGTLTGNWPDLTAF